jgi:site-specific recombinase XerD
MGIPVHVVQKMAGHRNLSTTQHYVHFLKADLEDAARRLDQAWPGGGNSGETASAAR